MITYNELDKIQQATRKTLAELVREKRGTMSMRQLSLNANVPVNSIIRIERGQNTSVKTAAKVCAALDLTILII